MSGIRARTGSTRSSVLATGIRFPHTRDPVASTRARLDATGAPVALVDVRFDPKSVRVGGTGLPVTFARVRVDATGTCVDATGKRIDPEGYAHRTQFVPASTTSLGPFARRVRGSRSRLFVSAEAIDPSAQRGHAYCCIRVLEGDKPGVLRVTGTRHALIGPRVDGTEWRLPKTGRHDLLIGTSFARADRAVPLLAWRLGLSSCSSGESPQFWPEKRSHAAWRLMPSADAIRSQLTPRCFSSDT